MVWLQTVQPLWIYSHIINKFIYLGQILNWCKQIHIIEITAIKISWEIQAFVSKTKTANICHALSKVMLYSGNPSCYKTDSAYWFFLKITLLALIDLFSQLHQGLVYRNILYSEISQLHTKKVLKQTKYEVKRCRISLESYWFLFFLMHWGTLNKISCLPLPSRNWDQTISTLLCRYKEVNIRSVVGLKCSVSRFFLQLKKSKLLKQP